MTRPLSTHPLADDARATLARLHNAAVARADELETRIERDQDLPRGPLPLMAKAAAHRTEAFHLLLALAALGDSEAIEKLAEIERARRPVRSAA